jgi:homopolymeric O-antigen transport system permease protein
MAEAATRAQPPVPDAERGEDFDLVIEAGRGFSRYWRDLWRYRGLLYFLAWRDVLVLYKQTAIGVAWAVLRPLLTMAVFTIIFGKLAKLPSEGAPYPVLVFSAMLPWQMFSNALQSSSSSLIDNTNLISKVYFPRLIVPASAVAASLVDFAISFAILLVMTAWFHVFPGARLLAVPLFVLLGLIVAFGAGLWFAALNVRYRDFRYVVPFALQLGLYVSPVGFSASVVPSQWHLVYSINPLVGVIDGFRWAIVGTPLDGDAVAMSCAVGAILLVSGIAYYRSVERTFADVI